MNRVNTTEANSQRPAKAAGQTGLATLLLPIEHFTQRWTERPGLQKKIQQQIGLMPA